MKNRGKDRYEDPQKRKFFLVGTSLSVPFLIFSFASAPSGRAKLRRFMLLGCLSKTIRACASVLLLTARCRSVGDGWSFRQANGKGISQSLRLFLSFPDEYGRHPDSPLQSTTNVSSRQVLNSVCARERKGLSYLQPAHSKHS